MTKFFAFFDIWNFLFSFPKNTGTFPSVQKWNINVPIPAQKIATALWKSYDKLFYGNGKKVYYKKYGSLNTLEGKSNKTGIRFKDDMIIWNGLEIPVVIDYDNYYEYQTLQCDICYCRIVRKYVRNKYKFYVQIVFKGNPPKKRNIGTKN